MPDILPKRRLPTRLWELLHEPRVITALMMLLYCVVTTMGAAVYVQPPSSISSELGWLTAGWAGLLVIGGTLGVVSTPRGIWWVERLAIIATATGTAVYLATVLQLHVSGSGNRIPQAGSIAIVLIALAIRWARIRYAALDPTK